MTLLGWLATVALVMALIAHTGTTALALWRVRRSPLAARDTADEARRRIAAVSVIVPVTQLSEIEQESVATAFQLQHPHFELLFCAPHEGDVSVSLLRTLMVRHPRVSARLLVGRDHVTVNPKLDNIEKAWTAAEHDLIVIADSNVEMPSDFIARLLAKFDETTGLVSSPPIGARPHSLAAEIECGFLNTSQARWLLAGDCLGLGFGHGKAMLVRRSLIEASGGLAALTSDVAEDMAATKLVRRAGQRVVTIDRPFNQPLGVRTFADVWGRQLRWAVMRRKSVPALYTGEILITVFPPVIAAAILANELGASPVWWGFIAAGFVYGLEALLAWSAGWWLSWRSPLAWLMRDVLISTIWTVAWWHFRYAWRGNRIEVGD